MSKTFIFSLPGITCINCVKPIESALNQCTKLKIEEFSIDVVEKCVSITVEDDGKSAQEMSGILRGEIEGVGVDCIEISAIDNNCNKPLNGDSIQQVPVAKHKTKNHKTLVKKHIIKGLTGSFLGLGLMGLMMSGVGMSLALMYGLALGCSALTIYLGKESYSESLKKLFKAKTLTMDSLFTISTLTVIGVSVASLYFPWLPMMMDAGLMIFGFRHLGKAIEESIKQKVISELSFKERATPSVLKEVATSHLIERIKCQANKLVPNDIILIKGGNVIPVDGICEQDSASIYDTIRSGSPLPRLLKRNQPILAGMKVPDDVAYLKMRVTHTAAESYLARLDEKLLKANAEKAPIETITNKILQYFVPTVLGLAAVSGIVVGSLFNPALAIQCATSVLVSACPCTLGFITPLAIKIGMTKGIENGVRFKNGKTLQAADQIDTVLLDLHGTLTTGIPIVKKYQLCAEEKIRPRDFLNYLALLERESQHPVAKSICDYIDRRKILINENDKLSEVDRTHHSGIKAKINGDSFLVGNKNLMTEEGIDLSLLEKTFKYEEAQQIIYLAKNGRVLGYIALKDPLRNDAKLTIDELKKMGKEVGICTGADIETAKGYAEALGIPKDKVFANCVGVTDHENDLSKTKVIENLQAQGKRVAMVGDAANDAVAIAKSNFGIAVKSHASDEMTQQEAGAIVEDASLLPIVTAFAVAKETVSSVKQNLLMSLAYNSTMLLLSGGILVGLGFALNPGIGVGLMILQTSLVLLNQYRIKRQSLAHLQNPVPVPSHDEPALETTYVYFKQTGICELKRSKSLPSLVHHEEANTTQKSTMKKTASMANIHQTVNNNILNELRPRYT